MVLILTTQLYIMIYKAPPNRFLLQFWNSFLTMDNIAYGDNNISMYTFILQHDVVQEQAYVEPSFDDTTYEEHDEGETSHEVSCQHIDHNNKMPRIKLQSNLELQSEILLKFRWFVQQEIWSALFFSSIFFMVWFDFMVFNTTAVFCNNLQSIN